MRHPLFCATGLTVIAGALMLAGCDTTPSQTSQTSNTSQTNDEMSQSSPSNQTRRPPPNSSNASVVYVGGDAHSTKTSEAKAGGDAHSSKTSKAPAGNDVQSPQQVSPGLWPTHASDDVMTWTSMAFPTGDPRTSVIGIERGSPREVRVGRPFDYQIVVTNLTALTVDAVVVTDQVGDNFKLTKSLPEADSSVAGTIAWPIGELPSGASKIIRVTGTGNADGEINTCSSVTYTSALCAAIPVVSPKLRLTKTARTDAAACDEIIYSFEVTNAGTGTIKDVTITDGLPEGVKAADGRAQIQIAAGTFAAGQTRTFTAKARAEKSGTYENQARAEGDGLSADSSNVSVTVRQPTLSVEVKCPKDALLGREITYTVTVKSTGPVASPNTMLTLTLPEGLAQIKLDNDGVPGSGKATWNLGTLNPNDTRVVTATLKPTSIGNMQASATVQGACGPQATAACAAMVQGVPDIGISLKDDTGVCVVGDNHTFTYTVKNQGQVDLTNVTMNATLSAGLDYVSSTAPTQVKADGKNLSWNLGTLKAGSNVTFTIVTKGTAAGEQAINTVTKSDQLQRTSDASEQVNFIAH